MCVYTHRCPKCLILTEAHKWARAAELQAYLRSCVAAAHRQLPRAFGGPAATALHAFLFAPDEYVPPPFTYVPPPPADMSTHSALTHA